MQPEKVAQPHTIAYAFIMPQKQQRLTQTDWLKLGFRILTEQGPSALRAELLAREIGATKGSFYWHFKDIVAFHKQMLALWEKKAGEIFQTPSDQSPTAKLLSLAETTASKNPKAEPILAADAAVRAWAQENAEARATLARVDQQRLDQLGRILQELGIGNPDFSRAIYAAMIGLDSLSTGNQDEDTSALSSLLAAVVALAES